MAATPEEAARIQVGEESARSQELPREVAACKEDSVLEEENGMPGEQMPKFAGRYSKEGSEMNTVAFRLPIQDNEQGADEDEDNASTQEWGKGSTWNNWQEEQSWDNEKKRKENWNQTWGETWQTPKENQKKEHKKERKEESNWTHQWQQRPNYTWSGGSNGGGSTAADGSTAAPAAPAAAPAAPAAADGSQPTQRPFPQLPLTLMPRKTIPTGDGKRINNEHTDGLAVEFSDNGGAPYHADGQESYWNRMEEWVSAEIFAAIDKGEQNLWTSRHPGKSQKIRDKHQYDLVKGIYWNTNTNTARKFRLVACQALKQTEFMYHIDELVRDPENYFAANFKELIWQFEGDKGWKNYPREICQVLCEAYHDHVVKSVGTDPPETPIPIVNVYFDPKAKKARRTTYMIHFKDLLQKREGHADRNIRVALEYVLWQKEGLHPLDGMPACYYKDNNIDTDVDGFPVAA